MKVLGSSHASYRPTYIVELSYSEAMCLTNDKGLLSVGIYYDINDLINGLEKISRMKREILSAQETLRSMANNLERFKEISEQFEGEENE